MNLNADFSRPVVARAADAVLVASPIPGVERRMLDRVGDEVARATSVVRYARNSSGTCTGGRGDLRARGGDERRRRRPPCRHYLRNPPGIAHAQSSRDGCLLYVKLRQFAPGDDGPLRIHTRNAAWRAAPVPGVSGLPLHSYEGVDTALVRWAPDSVCNPQCHPGGEEIYVLDGVLRDQYGDYPAGTWLRRPRGSAHAPHTRSEGALLYVKVGYLGSSAPAV